jgi:hypothetical protein
MTSVVITGSAFQLVRVCKDGVLPAFMEERFRRSFNAVGERRGKLGLNDLRGPLTGPGLGVGLTER